MYQNLRGSDFSSSYMVVIRFLGGIYFYYFNKNSQTSCKNNKFHTSVRAILKGYLTVSSLVLPHLRL